MDYRVSAVNDFFYTGGGFWAVFGRAYDENGGDVYFQTEVIEGEHRLDDVTFFSAYPFEKSEEGEAVFSFMPLGDFDSLICDSFESGSEAWAYFWHDVLVCESRKADSDAKLYIDDFRSYLNGYSASVNGKWCADIIHTDDASPKSFIYKGSFYFESGMDVTAHGDSWKTFCADVREKTGISLPKRSEMKFYKLSDYEQIAGIDASNIRSNGCMVSMKERICGNWRASEAVYGILWSNDKI